MLREEWAHVRSLCWADSTIKAYKSRWRRYFTFCDIYDLLPLPVDIEGACLYIVHLTKSVCYLTITNYVSSVWKLHDYLGYAHPDPSCFLIQSTLRGAKRLLGSATKPALPVTPANLVDIFYRLDFSKYKDLQFWCALVLSFRCLLRVGHITRSPHEIQVRDIEFTDCGMDLTIRSSKTIQFRERVNVVPVVESKDSVLCPVAVLRDYLAARPRKPTDPLFGVSYSTYSSKFSSMCKAIGLEGQYTTHSVRRGAATYLASFLPLHDVKTYGDWRSWAVLIYLSDTYDSRKYKDAVVADKLSVFY